MCVIVQLNVPMKNILLLKKKCLKDAITCNLTLLFIFPSPYDVSVAIITTTAKRSCPISIVVAIYDFTTGLICRSGFVSLSLVTGG